MVTLDVSHFAPVRAGEAPESLVQHNATTLADSVAFAEQRFNVRITPAPGDRHFFFAVIDPTPQPRLWWAPWKRRPPPAPHPSLDIHVLRGGEEICPRHDLAFSLLPGDVVRFDPLLC